MFRDPAAAGRVFFATLVLGGVPLVARTVWGVGLGISFALMIVASTGRIPPSMGAVLQEVLDAAVIVNALRARGGG